mmetsp:Transcript_63530/g.148142  ORF Transcript_63530/g.148142 Transcript_63530/m.148142 type:complete len:218 (-) Transcript_63530:16-669(-)
MRLHCKRSVWPCGKTQKKRMSGALLPIGPILMHHSLPQAMNGGVAACAVRLSTSVAEKRWTTEGKECAMVVRICWMDFSCSSFRCASLSTLPLRQASMACMSCSVVMTSLGSCSASVTSGAGAGHSTAAAGAGASTDAAAVAASAGPPRCANPSTMAMLMSKPAFRFNQLSVSVTAGPSGTRASATKATSTPPSGTARGTSCVRTLTRAALMASEGR